MEETAMLTSQPWEPFTVCLIIGGLVCCAVAFGLINLER